MKTIKSHQAFSSCGKKHGCVLQASENMSAARGAPSRSRRPRPCEIARGAALRPRGQNARDEIRAGTQSRYRCRAVRWHASIHVKKKHVSGTPPSRAGGTATQCMWTEQLHIREGPEHRLSSRQTQKEVTEARWPSEPRLSRQSSGQTGGSVGSSSGDVGYGATLDSISVSTWGDLFSLEGWLVWVWGLVRPMPLGPPSRLDSESLLPWGPVSFFLKASN